MREDKSNKNKILIIAIISIMVLVFFVFWKIKNINEVEKIGINNSVLKEDVIEKEIKKVSGQVISLADFSGVPEVQLSVGDTSIRTQASGNFVFTSLDETKKLILAFSELNKDLTFSINSENLRIYFSVELFNRLIDIINDESIGDINKIYMYLVDDVKARVSLSDFQSSYPRLFTQEISDGSAIYIDSINIYDNWSSEYGFIVRKVVEVVVLNNNQSKSYYFTNKDNYWKLLK